MATLGIHTPPHEVIGRMAALPGARVTPGAVFTIDGPAPSGPEQASAVLVLQTTLVDDAAAARFWASNESVLQAAIDSPGFVRFMAFGDGFCNYAIVFWRSMEEARAFGEASAHRDAVTSLYREPSQYTHFARLYAAPRATPRRFFCDACGHVTNVPAQACAGCGNPLTDVFDSYARGANGT